MATDRREFMIQSAGALAGVALLPGLEGWARSIEDGYPVGIIWYRSPRAGHRC